MSNLVKVFIVLNLVLSVVFVAAAATLLGKAESWKQAYETLEKKKDEEIKTLTEEKNRIQGLYEQEKTAKDQAITERDNAMVKNNSLDEQLTEQKRTNEKLQGNLSELREQLKTLAATMSQAQTDRETYLKRMEAAEDKARKSVASKEAAENEVQRLEAQIAQLKEEQAQLERDMAEVRKDLDHKNTLVKLAIDRGFDVQGLLNAPPIEAVVQNVNEDLKFVILSAGADHKVVKGMRFQISRGGSYIGEVEVDYVYPKLCSASFKMLKPGTTIQPGDTAATRL